MGIAKKLEVYDGSNWLDIVIGDVSGTLNQVNVSTDSAKIGKVISLADNPVFPGKSYIIIPVGTIDDAPNNPQVGMLRCIIN